MRSAFGLGMAFHEHELINSAWGWIYTHRWYVYEVPILVYEPEHYGQLKRTFLTQIKKASGCYLIIVFLFCAYFIVRDGRMMTIEQSMIRVLWGNS